MTPRLIALDLDDTLLHTDLSISDFSREICARVSSEFGVYICLATGRTPESARPYARFLNLDRYGSYCVCDNGSRIVRACDMRSVYIRTLDYGAASIVYKAAEELKIPCQIYDGGVVYLSRRNEFTEIDRKLTGLPQRLESDFDALLRRGCAKLVLAANPDALDFLEPDLKNVLTDLAVVVRSKPFFLEILPFGTGKGAALKELAAMLGVNQSEVMAFGDAMNDEQMIRWAGTGVAMLNGLEEIRRAADAVTDFSNDEDGAAKFIARVFNL